ncbi:MAG: NACHT domain-containing protein [Cyanobium sp.]|jgi:hypothetical protein
MPDVSGALKLLSKPLEDIAKLYFDECGEQLAKLRAENNLKQLYAKLNITQKVKTIWNVDRPIAISSFYYPAKIIVSPRKRQIVERLDDIEGNAVVLQGIIGQGKSILLRHLLGKEIRSGQRVPLFVELRHAKAENLETYIHAQFNELLGTAQHPRMFDIFAKEGKISLLLDGFDEVENDHITSIIQSIEKLAQRYPKAKIVVTSRPNSGIESSAYFTIKKIAPLRADDYWGFFRKVLQQDAILASRLYHAVLAPKSQISNLVSTPLLATLLTIVYRVNQKIPSDFSDFYDELFQILLVRHDRAKPGYERRRKTRLSDRELQQAFEAYCYKQKAQQIVSISRTKALEIASASIKALNLESDEGHFLNDIIKITCLLQEEGGQIEFLHQSIQEFFAAKYIASRPEEVASKFYTLNLDGTRRQTWDQVLMFLLQIDQYRSSEYFYIPVLEITLTHLESLEEPAAANRLRELISDRIGVTQSISIVDGAVMPQYSVTRLDPAQLYGIKDLLASVFQMLFNKPPSYKKKRWSSCFDRITDQQFLSYTDIAVQCGEIEALDRQLRDRITELRSSLEFHKSRIRTLDMSADFMEL